MPDSPNPVAADVVSQPSPVPQTQSPDVGTQIPVQPIQQFSSPAVGLGGNPAAAAQLAKQVKTGLGFHALMGTHTEYKNTPNGPVATPVQNTPGQLFRSILAGAIMGMGAGGGQDNAGSGWAAAAHGAAAARQGMQQEQEQRRLQAQQEWQNSLAAKKEQREAAAAETEQQVRKAQTAQANAETLRSNVLTQGASFALHQQIADADKDRISTFTNAGIKPLFENISETQMQDIIKNSPGASSLDWRHTGVKTTIGPDGQPQYEYTLSAYDPKASAPLSEATVKQWEQDGLFKYHPEYKAVATPGKTLTVDQFTALDKQAQNYYNQDLAKNKTQLEVDHLKAQIDEAKAAVRAHNASAAAEGLNAQEKKLEIDRKEEEDKAWNALTAVGNDPDKLTDPHQRAILARSVQPLMQESLNSIKAAAAEAQNGDKAAEAELPQLWNQYNTYAKLASLSPAGAKTDASAMTNPVSDLKEGTVSSAPAPLKPVLNVYLTGGPIGNISVPPPKTYDDFVNNLVRSQEQIPDAAKLSPQDYQTVLEKGKEYFDKLPKAQESSKGIDRSRKLAVVKAKNPNLDLSKYNLDDFSSTGVYQPKPETTRPAY